VVGLGGAGFATNDVKLEAVFCRISPMFVT